MFLDSNRKATGKGIANSRGIEHPFPICTKHINFGKINNA